jgi:hypothetical protein
MLKVMKKYVPPSIIHGYDVEEKHNSPKKKKLWIQDKKKHVSILPLKIKANYKSKSTLIR